MPLVPVRVQYYQQFDADYTRDVPGEGYGGWKETTLDMDPLRTAFVLMHAWDVGAYEQFPGQWRAVEYVPRSYAICRDVIPGLLAAVRASRFRLYHVVGGGDYYKDCPGYKAAVALAGPPPAAPERIPSDPARDRLVQFRENHVSVGAANNADVDRSRQYRRFPAEALPRDDEGVAENGHQLFALCKRDGVNHLVYAGFAINWCLLMSPGGMMEMSQRGFLCSAVREAVTAVENKESARRELNKEEGLWRTALAFGFVFHAADFIAAARACPARSVPSQ